MNITLAQNDVIICHEMFAIAPHSHCPPLHLFHSPFFVQSPAIRMWKFHPCWLLSHHNQLNPLTVKIFNPKEIEINSNWNKFKFIINLEEHKEIFQFNFPFLTRLFHILTDWMFPLPWNREQSVNFTGKLRNL